MATALTHPPKFTQVQVQQMIEYVTEQGTARSRKQGRNFNDVDFACGAMAVMFFLRLNAQVPAVWIMGPLSGRSLFIPDPNG